MFRCVGSDIENNTITFVLGEGVTEEEVLAMHMMQMYSKVHFACPECEGTGEVPADVFDPDSGQYQRGVGVQKCICQIEE